MRFRIVIVAILGALLLTAACGESDTTSDRLQVVATVYPLGYFAERIGGDRAEVNVLVGPGLEAHGFEPTSSDLLALGDADVIVMNGIGLEPWMDGAIDAIGDDVTAIVVEASDPAQAMEGEVHAHGEEEGDHGDEDADEEGDHGDEDVDEEGDHGNGDADEEGDHGDEDADEGRDHGDDDADADADPDEAAGEHGDEEEGDHGDEESELDPHMWLSPTLAAHQVERIRDAFIAADADNADGYRQRADEVIAELDALDHEFEESLGACTHDHFVTSHAAYGYLAAQYGLEQIAVAGLSADVAPSPQRLANVTDRVTELGLGHVMVEPVLSDRLAQTIARETGIELLSIHAIGSVTENELEAHGDYFGLMRDNLANLKVALECE